MSDGTTPDRTAPDGDERLDQASAQEAPGSERAHARTDRAAQKRNRTTRLAILGAILALVTGLSIAHQKLATVKFVGVDALCPFGGIETLWSLVASGGLIQKVAASSVILLLLTLALMLVYGRAFCGFLCPLGALQEFAGKLRRLFGLRRRIEVPAGIDRYARFLKYIVLIVFTAATWSAASLVIRPYDPWVAWTHLTSAELLTEFSIGLGVLVVSLVGSVVYDRFFCKYLCPMGAVLALGSPLSWLRIRRDAETCTSCGACDKACPMNVTVSTVERVTSTECISCNECVNACAAQGALTIAEKGRAGAHVLQPAAVTMLVVALTAVGIGVTSAGGVFAWTMPSAAEAIQLPGGGIDAEQIKGSMSFAEISSATGIAPEVFEERFGIKPSDMTAKIKDLAPVYGFDVHTDVREFVQQQYDAGSFAPASTQGEATSPGED